MALSTLHFPLKKLLAFLPAALDKGVLIQAKGKIAIHVNHDSISLFLNFSNTLIPDVLHRGVIGDDNILVAKLGASRPLGHTVFLYRKPISSRPYPLIIRWQTRPARPSLLL